MWKKVIFLVIILFLLGGGVFYWWQSQKDVRELNKTLPVGVRVVKNLVGQEYKVVNKIDGYEFKVPKEWKGVKGIEYTPERKEGDYTGTSINLEGKEGGSRVLFIDQFKNKESNFDLGLWAKNSFNNFGMIGSFENDKIGEFETVKTQENVHLLGMWVYFFKRDFTIYSITNGSEESIRYIISNGKW